MRKDISNMSRKDNPHLLVLPPWFDLGFSGLFAQMFHRFTEDIAMHTRYKPGLIYGEYHIGQFNSEWIEKEGLRYNFLGQKKWTLPKVGFGWKQWLGNYRKLFLNYQRRYGKPDLIHAQSILGLIVAASFNSRYGIPFIYTEHMSSLITGDLPDRLLNKALRSAVSANKVTAVSPVLKESMERIYGVPTEYVPNYIDSGFYIPPIKIVQSPDFISIGSPAHTKGMDRLIEAFGIVKKKVLNARLTLVDDIKGAEDLQDKIKNMGLEGAIHFAGAVKREGIRSLLQNSAVLVSASRKESFGLTMIEALSCGIPVVATQTAGSELIVTEKCGVIIPQGDIQELANGMISVFRKRNNYSPNELHNNVKARFGKEKVLKKWEAIYDEILNGNFSNS
ncbi:glycosyltransferase family 4 protein [Membranihabitans maritimus]|uniref:glycosyltransferase family 4 protein n=1 Tax=Membranihabitans maritimus TaxID=2904244 RepID=UPI001F23280E|nr:glycosyltransferase family 4 protein [Membranihabitans maritimus]